MATTLLVEVSQRLEVEKEIRQTLRDRMNLGLASKTLLNAAISFRVSEIALRIDLCQPLPSSPRPVIFYLGLKPRISKRCDLCGQCWLVGGSHSIPKHWLVCHDPEIERYDISCPYFAAQDPTLLQITYVERRRLIGSESRSLRRLRQARDLVTVGATSASAVLHGPKHCLHTSTPRRL